jgi:signal transduction histidine kinase
MIALSMMPAGVLDVGCGAGRIEESGRTMLSIINLSLDLYKMEPGTYEMEPEDVDVLVIIAEIMDGVLKLGWENVKLFFREP